MSITIRIDQEVWAHTAKAIYLLPVATGKRQSASIGFLLSWRDWSLS